MNQICTFAFVGLFLLSNTILPTTCEAAATAPRATPHDVTKVDSKANLDGDNNRDYLDIREVTLNYHDDTATINVRVSGAFPNAELLLGTGIRFDIGLYTSPVQPQQKSENQSRLQVSYTNKGWSYLYFPTVSAEPGQSTDIEMSFQATASAFSLSFPSRILDVVNTVEVSSTSADYPKWKPITGNPPVIITLDQTPSAKPR